MRLLPLWQRVQLCMPISSASCPAGHAMQVVHPCMLCTNRSIQELKMLSRRFRYFCRMVNAERRMTQSLEIRVRKLSESGSIFRVIIVEKN